MAKSSHDAKGGDRAADGAHKKAGKKSSRHSREAAQSVASATIADVVPRTKKEAALQRALAATLGGAGTGPSSSSHTAPSSGSTAPSEPDTYGKGSATDRLQFGYAPTNAEEAVAFHAHIPAEEWLRQRRINGRIAFVKHQKLPKTNCEPALSVLKLKNHWNTVSKFQSGLRSDHMTTQDADELLEMLAAKQRVNPQS